MEEASMTMSAIEWWMGFSYCWNTKLFLLMITSLPLPTYSSISVAGTHKSLATLSGNHIANSGGAP